MTRIMYDSVNPSAIPAAAQMVAGYVDGLYAWPASGWARFPDAVRVEISVEGSGNAGQVLDVEPGDAGASQTEGWIERRKAAGIYRPTIYTSLDNVPAVRIGTGKYVLGTDYDLWVADYDGSTASVYTGSAAKQYETTAAYDVSIVYDNAWPHLTATASAVDVWPAGVILQLGSTGAPVEALQLALNDADLYGARGLAVDGDFGPITQTAVRGFESDTSLTVDAGIAGPEVRAKLITLGHLTVAGEAK